MDEERKELIYKEYDRIFEEITTFKIGQRLLPGVVTFLGGEIDLSDSKQIAVAFYYLAKHNGVMEQLRHVSYSDITYGGL